MLNHSLNTLCYVSISEVLFIFLLVKERSGIEPLKTLGMINAHETEPQMKEFYHVF